jgi:hypothetical protein
MQMLNALADTIRPAVRSTEQISADLETVNDELATIRSVYAEACLDCEVGIPNAEKRKQHAEAECLRLTKRRDELQAASTFAKARAAQKQQITSRENRSAQWTTAIKLAESRSKETEKLSKQLAEVSATYSKIRGASVELHSTLCSLLGDRLDLDGALLRENALETAIRFEALRAGIEWAASWP